jgi:hypothetical protein
MVHLSSVSLLGVYNCVINVIHIIRRSQSREYTLDESLE